MGEEIECISSNEISSQSARPYLLLSRSLTFTRDLNFLPARPPSLELRESSRLTCLILYLELNS